MNNKIKIDYLDEERFRKYQKRKMEVKRKIICGIAMGLIGTGIVTGTIINKNSKSNDTNVTYTSENDDLAINDEAIEVNLADVNNLNIIINDHDCSDLFFENVCNKLENDGIKFTKTSGNKNIDVNGAVVVTLDQQYLSGPGMVIFTPNDNNRKGESDALALAMETGFYENGFFTDGIFSGKIGYRETKLGEVQSRIPTSSEEAISEENNTSFTTISFGTTNTNADLVAKSIESGLARYINYEKEKAYGDDLIYRVEGGDMMGNVENVFGCSQEKIESYNDLRDNKGYVYMNDTLRNPNIESYKSFDSKTPVNLYVSKTNWY